MSQNEKIPEDLELRVETSDESEVYSIPWSCVGQIAKELQNRLGTDKKGLYKAMLDAMLKVEKQERGQNQDFSFHQHVTHCASCVYSYPGEETRSEKTPGRFVECSYKDPTIASLEPLPNSEERCEWLTFFRLAHQNGLLDRYSAAVPIK